MATARRPATAYEAAQEAEMKLRQTAAEQMRLARERGELVQAQKIQQTIPTPTAPVTPPPAQPIIIQTAPPQQPAPQAPTTTATQGGAAGVLGNAALESIIGGSESASVATPQVISVGGQAVPNAAPSLAGPLGFGPSAGVAAGTALTIKGLNDLRKGRTDNSNVGKASRIQTGITTGGLSEVGRFFGIGGGKNPDQQNRDQVRSKLKEIGFLDDNWNVTLANGQTFDFGKDGGASLQNLDGQGSRPYYNTDPSNPLVGDTIALVSPLAELMTGGDSKLRDDFAGYLTNAATQGAESLDDVIKNIQGFYAQLGVTREDMDGFISELQSSGVIDEQRANVYRASASKFQLPSSGQQDLDGATGGGSFNFDNVLGGAIKKLNADAAASVAQARKQSLMQSAMETPNIPKIESSTVRTGVEDLDNILQGVLQ